MASDLNQSPPAPAAAPQAGKIAVNSFWMTADNLLALIGGVVSSIVVARAFGPTVMGHYSYVMWLVSISSTLGRFGLPTATRRYLAEYHNQPAMAHGILRSFFRLQGAIGVLCVAIGLVLVQFSIPAEYHLFAFVGVAAILPGMMMAIASGANEAIESFAPNVKASVVGNFANFFGVLLTVWLGWGLIGLSLTLFISRVADFAIRYLYYRRSYASVLAHPPSALPADLRSRLITFCTHSTLLQVFNLVVWDRSEMLFLKRFSPAEQLAFYSVSFSMIRQTSTLYRPFMAAAGVSLIRRHVADPAGAGVMAATMLRYIALLAFPLNLGLAAVSGPLMTVFYGSKYLEAIPVMAIVGLLGSAQALLMPAEQYLISVERQNLLIRGMIWTSLVNIALALLLIPKGGAVGAAICNGLSQTAGTVIVWGLLRREFPVAIPWQWLLRCLGASLSMAAVAGAISISLPAMIALPLGVCAGAASFAVFLRVFGCLRGDDSKRLESIGHKVPRRFRPWASALISFLTAAPARSTSTT